MKPGDFTNLGELYRKYRVGYATEVLDLLVHFTHAHTVVDVGAGTGIWTKQLAQKKLHCTAVEPNDDMRENGAIFTTGLPVEWKKGSAEHTGLPAHTADWVTMASAFHWADPKVALPEFHRILKPGGHLTLIWNPTLKEGDEVQEAVEELIKEIVPEFSRGSRAKDDWGTVLTSTGHFTDVIEIRKVTYIRRSVDEYVETWRAVNHLQAVAGPERFERLLEAMRKLFADREYIDVAYLTKSWTAKRVD